jgi:hypothetical protein
MSHQASPERAASDSDKKKDLEMGRVASQVPSPTGWSSWFGGPDVVIGPRIGPVLSSISLVSDSDTEYSSTAILDKQIAAEDGHAIQYRTCSWQKVRVAFEVPLSSVLDIDN